MRIVAWNCETLSKRLGQLPGVAQALGSPDVLCLQEVRVHAGDARMLETALPGYHCFHSLASARRYGVATFVKGEGIGAAPEWDQEGRVVVVTCEGTAIVNVYAVNGTSRPHPGGGDRHAFKREFQRRVFELGKELGPRVVMAGDWNVSRTKLDTHPRLRTEEPHAKARAELNALLEETGFVDIWRARNPEGKGYTWFNPRARYLDAARVDYVLVSPALVPDVRDASIGDKQPWSDHRPVTITLA